MITQLLLQQVLPSHWQVWPPEKWHYRNHVTSLEKYQLQKYPIHPIDITEPLWYNPDYKRRTEVYEDMNGFSNKYKEDTKYSE